MKSFKILLNHDVRLHNVLLNEDVKLNSVLLNQDVKIYNVLLNQDVKIYNVLLNQDVKIHNVLLNQDVNLIFNLPIRMDCTRSASCRAALRRGRTFKAKSFGYTNIKCQKHQMSVMINIVLV